MTTEALYPEVICFCTSEQKALLAPISQWVYVGVEKGEEHNVKLISSIGEFTYSLDTFLRDNRVSFPICSMIFSLLDLAEPTNILIPTLLDLDSALDWAPIILGMTTALNNLYSLKIDPLEVSLNIARHLSNKVLEYAIKAAYFKGFWYCKPTKQIRTDITSFPAISLTPIEGFYVTIAEPGYIVKLFSHGNVDKACNFLWSRSSKVVTSKKLIKQSSIDPPIWLVGKYAATLKGEIEIVL